MGKRKNKKTKELRKNQIKVSFTNSEFKHFLQQIGLDYDEVCEDRSVFSNHIAEYVRGTVIRKRPKKIKPITRLIHTLSAEIRELEHFLEGFEDIKCGPYIESIQALLKNLIFESNNHKGKGGNHENND